VTPYKLTFYFIKSPIKLNWATPRSLYITTAINHLVPDYAPIGHVLVGLEGPGTSILTGMSRKDFKESARIVKSLGLGLGSMVYDFEGGLDSCQKAQDMLGKARKHQRLNQLSLEITRQDFERINRFLHRWITSGAHEHYGNLDIQGGQGAGCGPFAGFILAHVVGHEEILAAWTRKVRVPAHLTGKVGEKKVSLFQVLVQGGSWGTDQDLEVEFFDPQLMFDHLQNHPQTKPGPPDQLNLDAQIWNTNSTTDSTTNSTTNPNPYPISTWSLVKTDRVTQTAEPNTAEALQANNPHPEFYNPS